MSIFFENILIHLVNFFLKKYSFEIKILSNDKFIIPEYKIDLLNKSKKVINAIENINSIVQLNKTKSVFAKTKKTKNKEIVKSKDRIKKTKSKKKIRTLWVRRKKN